MPKKPYARIAITLPAQDLAAADRLAARHDRSRSWIVAEAIRRYVASGEAEDASALGASRHAQLLRDIGLTPEQRVREAEETLRLTDLMATTRPLQPKTFDSYEAFLDWKRHRDVAT